MFAALHVKLCERLEKGGLDKSVLLAGESLFRKLLLGTSDGLFSCFFVDFCLGHRHVGHDGNPVRKNLEKTTADRQILISFGGRDLQLARVHLRHERHMIRKDPEITLDPGNRDHLRLTREGTRLRGDDLEVESCHFLGILGGREHLIDAALHVEVAFRDLVELTVKDLLEATDRIGNRNVLSLGAGEDFGDMEGLAEETLDFAGAVDGELVLRGELVHAQDRDDILKILVALKHLLDAAGHRIVLLAHDLGSKGLGG